MNLATKQDIKDLKRDIKDVRRDIITVVVAVAGILKAIDYFF